MLKEKLTLIFVAAIVVVLVLLNTGCSTVPPSNININASPCQSDEVCSPTNIVIYIVNDNDKALIGDKGNINDDDGGQTPSLGL